MKKIFSKLLVLVIAIISICGITSADEATSNNSQDIKISFRNMPWNTTIGDFVKNTGAPSSEYNWWKGDTQIPDDGYSCSVESVYNIGYYMDCPYNIKSISDDTYDYVPGRRLDWYYFSFGKEQPLNVAGYDISRTTLYFMQPVTNGIVNHNKEDAVLYMAEYVIDDNLDRISVFDDLTAKLSSLYGEMVYELFDGQVIRMWKDSEGNTVSLIRHDTQWEVLDEINIVYMSGTAMDNLQILNDALYNEQSITDSNNREDNANNYDGL